MKKILFFCVALFTNSYLSSMYNPEKSSLGCVQARLRTLMCLPNPSAEQKHEIDRLTIRLARDAQEKNQQLNKK